VNIRDDGSTLVFSRVYSADDRLLRSDEAVIPPRADLTGDGVVDSNDVARLVADLGPASHTEQRRARSASEGLEPSSPV